MDQYQKIPVIVDAIRLMENNIKEVYSEIHGEPHTDHSVAQDKWHEYEQIVIKEGMALKTPESGEGTQIASVGDYIVFGYSEELGRHCWPVKSDYFKNAYEKID